MLLALSPSASEVDEEACDPFALWLCVEALEEDFAALDEELCAVALEDAALLDSTADDELLLLELTRMGAGLVPKPSPSVAVLMICAVAKTVISAMMVRIAIATQRFRRTMNDPEMAPSFSSAAACVYLACCASKAASSFE